MQAPEIITLLVLTSYGFVTYLLIHDKLSIKD